VAQPRCSTANPVFPGKRPGISATTIAASLIFLPHTAKGLMMLPSKNQTSSYRGCGDTKHTLIDHFRVILCSAEHQGLPSMFEFSTPNSAALNLHPYLFCRVFENPNLHPYLSPEFQRYHAPKP